MRGEGRKAMDDGPVDAQTYARAILNILDDSAEEKARLGDTQRAILNILEDSADEKNRIETTQRAVLNILDDSVQEKARLGDTQRAILNILDDFDVEKTKVEQVNVALRNEIAERTRVEEALRHANAVAEAANRELEAFSYSVSHDLRAPLRGIDGWSLALLEDYYEKIDEQARQYLSRVRAETQRMGQLIDDLLQLSRVARADLRAKTVNLTAIAHAQAARLQETHPERQVEFIIQPDLIAKGDPPLMEVVLSNLLGNAFKFTGKRAEARIEFGQTDDDGQRAFFVRDNGAGFDMAYASKLFGAFQRMHKTAEFPGTGVGLATVQRIIHRHGGQVWAEAEVNEGATFYFTLKEAV